jgi:regulator of sigma E protease
VSWILAFAGFAFLIIAHEFGHFIAAKKTGMRVEKFYLFFPPALFKRKRGETEYGIGAIPAGGFVKITGMNPDEDLPPEIEHRGYYHQPVWKRIVVIGAGPAVNLLIAFAILFVLAFGVREATGLVGQIEDGSPAAGKLQAGDEIVAVDGTDVSGLSVDQRQQTVAETVAGHECEGEQTDGCRAETPVTLTVVRGGETRDVEIVPFYDVDVQRSRLGFAYGDRALNPGPLEAARISLDFMWTVTSGTVSTIAQLFKAEKREEVSGIVGSYEVTRQSIEFSARQALTLIAVISLSLAIINLFPFLPLDGGHIFWSLVEKIRGRPVPFSWMERASVVGFVLVLMLFVIGFTNDIDRLRGEGFDVR